MAELAHTHTHTHTLYRSSVNCFFFVLSMLNFSMVGIIFQILTQILMVTPPAYTLDVDMPPSSMPPMQLQQRITCPVFFRN